MSIQKIIRQFEPEQHNLLNILHALQNSSSGNYLSKEAMEETARYLGLTKASVYGVATYYTMFSLKPRGRFIIRICVSPVCELMKVDIIIKQIESILDIKVGETSSDRLFTLELSECLGQCQKAPSMMVNDRVYKCLGKDSIKEIIEKYRQKAKLN